jgi:hypothetical protein
MHPNSSRTQSNPQSVTNAQIEQLLAMREAQKGLKDRLKLMDDAIDTAETALIAQISNGADLSKCGFDVRIQETERRYPAWKEYFIEKLGKGAADAILVATEPTVHRRVVIK